jgi:hypothetical protein
MPLHKKRRWVIQPAESAAWLAEQLIGRSWCSCQGWSLAGYLFMNDQTSADGAFEVAIVKPPATEDGHWYQVESVTFGWLSGNYKLSAVAQARHCIESAIAGRFDPGQLGSVAWPIDRCRVETPEQHGRCGHCA